MTLGAERAHRHRCSSKEALSPRAMATKGGRKMRVLGFFFIVSALLIGGASPGLVGAEQGQLPGVSLQSQRRQTSHSQSQQIPGDRARQIPRDQRSQVPRALQSSFEIPSPQDEVRVTFQVAGTGLYSAEISFRCEDAQRKHDRISMSLQSGARPVSWFGQGRTLDPEISYRFYFWVDQAILQQIGADKTLRFVLGRKDRVRSRMEGEFESRRRVSITLPRITGRIHFRVPSPILVDAKATNTPSPLSLTLNQKEIVQYRVAVNFPRLGSRANPRKFKAEFRVPLSRGRRNADIGGFLLKDGRWQRRDQVTDSGTYDFLASPAMEFSQDVNGRRAFPLEEDWAKFKREGMLARLDASTVRVNALFYIEGGEIPSDYYVVGLEKIQLSTVPDEGEGAFWLRLNFLASLDWKEKAPESKNPFGNREDTPHALVQTRMLRIAVPRSGESKGIARPGVPLVVLPASTLEGKERLVIRTDPHYFHDMPVSEQADYIVKETGAEKFIEGLLTQNPKKLVEGIGTFLYNTSRAKNPDLYRSFGMDSFETDTARNWALQNSPSRLTVEGESSGKASFKEAYGTSNRSVATVTAVVPDANPGRTHSSTVRVRKVPGIFVEGAQIKILKVKTNKNFDGYLKLYLGIAGHAGGRQRDPSKRIWLGMESAALESPWSFWIHTTADRGPYNFRPGAAQAIDFTAIDFDHPEREQDAWEQLSTTFGPWAALHVRVALDRQRGKTTSLADEGYITMFPYDYLFGELKASSRREGDWVILKGTVPVHSHILDEVTLEVRLKVQARDNPIFIRQTTKN